jgi:hypothetical protein
MRELVLVALGCLLNQSVADSAVMGDIRHADGVAGQVREFALLLWDRMMLSMNSTI